MKEERRSLYQCFSARVLFDRIYCAAGYRLNSSPKKDGTVNITRLINGAPLELSPCQQCQDYDEMGPPIPVDERGWIELLKAKPYSANQLGWLENRVPPSVGLEGGLCQGKLRC